MSPHNARGRLAVCAILKNEARNVLEWIAYHRVIGVERFFLYDNNSTDDIADFLAPLVAQGIVDYIPWPINPGQIEAYAHHIDASWDDFEWTAFIDLDEFIVYSGAGSLPDWLGRQEGVSAISLHWKNFGPSGNDVPPTGLMLTAYDRRLPDDAATHGHVKTILRSRTFVRSYTPHAFEVIGRVVNEHGAPALRRDEDGDYSIQAPFRHGEIWINHYYTRSRLEWQEKVERGMADSAVGAPNRRDLGWLSHYERDAIVEDRTIMCHATTVATEIGRLRALPIPAIPMGADVAPAALGTAGAHFYIATGHGTLLGRDRIGRLWQVNTSGGLQDALRVSGANDTEDGIRAVIRGVSLVWLGENQFLVQRNGRFLCAAPDGSMSIDRKQAADWEIFRLVPETVARTL